MPATMPPIAPLLSECVVTTMGCAVGDVAVARGDVDEEAGAASKMLEVVVTNVDNGVAGSEVAIAWDRVSTDDRDIADAIG